MFLSKIWLDCILYRGTAPELTFKCQPCKTFKRTQAIRWLLPTSCMSVFDHFGGVGSETINYFRQKALSKMSGNVLVTLLVSGYDYLIFVIFFFFFFSIYGFKGHTVVWLVHYHSSMTMNIFILYLLNCALRQKERFTGVLWLRKIAMEFIFI